MSQAEHVQPHQQDDCQGCQKERAQNNQLIDFYERLHKIKTKVGQIKPSLDKHCTVSKQQRSKLQRMSNQIAQPPSLNNELNNLDSKQMGYQLACALLERQIKMKKQNQMLASKIKVLKELRMSQEHGQGNIRENSTRTGVIKKDSEMQSQMYGDIMPNSKVFSNNQSRMLRTKQSKSLYSDSLDSAIDDTTKNFWGNQAPTPLRSQRQSKEQNSRYSIPFSAKNSQKDSSTFSSFEQTGRSIFSPASMPTQQQNKKKFQNLNLWLYQFQDEQGLYSKEKHNNETKVNLKTKGKLKKK